MLNYTADHIKHIAKHRRSCFEAAFDPTVKIKPLPEELAQRFYRNSLREASARHRAWAEGHYAQVASSNDTRFWKERSAGAVVPVDEGSTESNEIHIPADASLRLSPQVEIVNQPCIVDRFVDERLAVSAPFLDGPVAFLGGIDLVPLVCSVQNGMTLADLLRSWASRLSPDRGQMIAQWLVGQRLLEVHRNAPAVLERSGT